MLIASHLSKEYDTARGPVHILDDVSLEVGRGDSVAIMGPLGCGKSTLLYMLGALERRLRDEKVRFLFVTTLHPDVDYEPYRRTRAFYESMGFELALSSAQGPVGPSSDPLACYLKLL